MGHPLSKLSKGSAKSKKNVVINYQIMQTKELSQLPNELLIAILINLDIQDLIHLRRVNSRWLAAIEQLCHQKRSLIICHNEFYQKNIDVLWLKLANIAILKLPSTGGRSHQRQFANFVPQMCNALSKLLPNLDTLVIRSFIFPIETVCALLDAPWKSQFTTLYLSIDNVKPYEALQQLADHINPLPCLKNLAFDTEILDYHVLKPTLAKLERLAVVCTFDCNRHEFVRYLGPQCTHLSASLSMDQVKLSYSDIRYWLCLNRTLFSNLTHLRLEGMCGYDALDLVCEQTTMLRVMQIYIGMAPRLEVETVNRMALMAHLTELSLEYATIEVDTFQLTQARPLVRVQVLDLANLHLMPNGSPDQFCRLLAALFPNVRRMRIDCRFKPEDFEPYLGLFPHLRQYKFNGHAQFMLI